MPESGINDRRKFLEDSVGLRELLIEVAWFWSDQFAKVDEHVRSRELHKTAVLWDFKLRQRLLLEEYLLGGCVAEGEQAVANPPSRWPLLNADYIPGQENRLADHLPLARRFALTAHSGESSEAIPRRKLESDTTLDRAKELVAGGLDEAMIARGMGWGTSVLRMSFDSAGRVLWWVLSDDLSEFSEFDPEEHELTDFEVTARGATAPRTRKQLQEALAIHEIRLQYAYHYAMGQFHDCQAEGAIADLPQGVWSIRRLLDYVLRRIQDEDAYGFAWACLEQLGPLAVRENSSFSRAACAELETHIDRNLHTGDEMEGIKQRLRAFIRSLPENQEHSPVEFWERLSTLLQNDLESEKGAEELIEDATLALRGEIENLLDLPELEGLFDPQTTNLVISVDGQLHGVPWSILRFGGKPLCYQVASIRCSLSPMLDQLQLERDEHAREAAGDVRGILAVSSFGEDCAPFESAISRTLHHMQRSTAEEYGHEYYGAAEHPRPDATWMSRFLSENKQFYRTLTVLAHGERHQAAISMPTGFWDGAGRLDHFEWLILCSCSTGMLNGGLDVDGFCVRLIANGNRSVLAPRWDVNASEGPLFVNAVLAEYLSLCCQEHESQQDHDDEEYMRFPLRAIALNTVRRQLLDHAGNPVKDSLPVGLNTLATFQLLGLG